MKFIAELRNISDAGKPAAGKQKASVGRQLF